MQNRFQDCHINYLVCDIRDFESLKTCILDIQPQIIINASAMKQVPTCERFPSESIKTNISGVENLIQICTEYYHPDIVLGVSTDKACKPVNVYGMCKAIGERLYIVANHRHVHAKFLCVRYGNVLESRGSIILLFKYHAKTDRVYSLTHPDMTRFFLSLDDSVKLVVNTIEKGKRGDMFIPHVKSGRIQDLAELFIERYGGEIKEVGIRPGEKIHEELINEEEMRRTYKRDDGYFVITPIDDTSDNLLPKADLKRYSSDLCLLTKDELRDYLERNNIFEKDFDSAKESEVRL